MKGMLQLGYREKLIHSGEWGAWEVTHLHALLEKQYNEHLQYHINDQKSVEQESHTVNWLVFIINIANTILIPI